MSKNWNKYHLRHGYFLLVSHCTPSGQTQKDTSVDIRYSLIEDRTVISRNFFLNSFIKSTRPLVTWLKSIKVDQYYNLYSNYKNDWSVYFCVFLFPLLSVLRILYSKLALLFESCMFSLLALILPAFVVVLLVERTFSAEVRGGSGNSTSVGQVFSRVLEYLMHTWSSSPSTTKLSKS